MKRTAVCLVALGGIVIFCLLPRRRELLYHGTLLQEFYVSPLIAFHWMDFVLMASYPEVEVADAEVLLMIRAKRFVKMISVEKMSGEVWDS